VCVCVSVCLCVSVCVCVCVCVVRAGRAQCQSLSGVSTQPHTYTGRDKGATQIHTQTGGRVE
jgi:hypothetical protein